MTAQPRKIAPDLDKMFFDENVSGEGSRKAKLREAKKTVRQAKKTVSPKALVPRNNAQARYLEALERYNQIFACGPAGVGKTYLGAYWAAQQVFEGKADKIILCRPLAMSKEDQIGHLPGDIFDKFAPWAFPVISAIEEAVGKSTTQKWLADGVIQYWLTAHLQGRTMNDSIVLFDEAQNSTVQQMLNFLTRAGENSTIIIDGDINQKRITGESGLEWAIDMAEDYEIDGVIVVEFTSDDVVRSGLCKAWVKIAEAEGMGVD